MTTDSPPTASPPPSSPPSSVAAATAATGGIPNLLLRGRIPKLEPRRRRGAPSAADAAAASLPPVPATPPLPPPSSAASASAAAAAPFAVPHRRILSPDDHALFLASPACTLLQAWVFGLADAVVDTPAGVFADALASASASAAPQTDGSSAAAAATLPTHTYQPTKRPQRALSPVVRALLGILDAVAALVRAHPPDDAGGSRFGNRRFRGFVDAVRAQAPAWHREALGLTDAGAVAEAAAYLAQSFGNRARIDYGSGHELHFVVWLLCLYELGLVRVGGDGDGADDDRAALVLCVFARYLDVMRLVQTTYYLEPAGSHGVWGLDDYQFLPFLFGAAQLLHHPYITPRAVHQPLTLEQFGDDYLYLGQVQFVNSIKITPAADVVAPAAAAPASAARAAADGGLRWHSPMLDDISAARSWAKIEGGMRRMFVAEVLRKLPVMQHFLFGSLVAAAPGMSEGAAALTAGTAADPNGETAADDDGDDIDTDATVDVFDAGGVRHIHTPSGWGDCCGIRVPSSFGAAGEMRKRGGDALRRIPFD